MEIHNGREWGTPVKLWEFKKHLVAALGRLGCFSVSIDCNSNLLKCPVNDLPSHRERRNSVFILLEFSFFFSFLFFPTVPQTDWRTDSFHSVSRPWKGVNCSRPIWKGGEQKRYLVSSLLMKAMVAKTKAKINRLCLREPLQGSDCISTS